MRGANENIITAWSDRADAPIISEHGLLKIDVLSLDGLTKQSESLKMIKEEYGVELDLDDLPVARDPEAVDEKTMDIFRSGQTLGVAQFGTRGLRRFLKQIKPDSFSDLVAANALYRPGPLEGGDAYKYGDIKNGKRPPEYWHESVKPFLEETYSIMAYQEQLMQIAQALGGFSAAEADDMRKATSKLYRMGKIEAQKFMAGYKERWDEGCKSNGLSQQEADYVWERMIAFASYSFNKAHAGSYSLMAYQDAYLKAHYPLCYYAAQLTYDKDVEEIVREARARKIDILGPDINESKTEFTIANDTLRYGLRGVKYVGDEAMQVIKEHRPYSSYEEFEANVPKKKCNARVKQYLVAAGAFDSFGMRDDWTEEEKREGELEAIGIAISGTGNSSKYSDIIESRIIDEDLIEELHEGDGLTVGGEFIEIKHHTIKSGKNKGKKMGFATLAYESNNYDCTFFRDKYNKYQDLLVPGNVVLVRGRKGDHGEVLVHSAVSVEELQQMILDEQR
jgi:DNA polymerase-3 subunit alpha